MSRKFDRKTSKNYIKINKRKGLYNKKVHLNIKVNPDSNPKGFFKSILIIDDDKEYCDCLGSFIANKFKNLMVACIYIPKKGLEIMKQMYFDVVVCDIKMDEISGDVLIPIIMKMSPSTKIVAMTGWGKHEAFLAGEVKPFRFIDKERGFEEGLKLIKEGINESDNNKYLYSFGTYCKETGCFKKEAIKYSRKIDFKKSFGFSLRKFATARKRAKAISLFYCMRYTPIQIKSLVPFYSLQTMKRSLGSLYPPNE